MTNEGGRLDNLVPVDSAIAQVKRLVMDSLTSPHSRRAYGRALDAFLAWWQGAGRPPFVKATVQAYRAHLEAAKRAPSTINVHLAALRKLAQEAADNGLLPADVAGPIAKVKGARKLGVRAGNWLTLAQAQQLLRAPGGALKGIRDRAILAMLVGCALRRTELCGLRVERIQQRDGRWVIVDLEGKGKRLRTVPVPAWVKVALDDWTRAAGILEGPVFRPVSKSGQVRHARQLTDKAVWSLLAHWCRKAGLPQVAPHDLRRTCARLCRAAGGDLEQIQMLLGHASIQTTERYLGTKQNLSDAPNDHIRLRL